jgi:Na+/proline symporter
MAGIFGYALGQAMPLFLLAFFGPLLLRLLPEGHGLGDYVHKRFGKSTALFTGVVMIFYMGTFLAAELTAIGQVMEFSLGIPMIVSCTAVMVLIFAYVFRGGLGASINTDKVQLYVLVPLMLVLAAAVAAAVSRSGSMVDKIRETAPELLSLGFWPGWKFGIVLFIGVTASNLFHQGFWQRVYSVEGSRSQKNAFLLGGAIIIPIVFLAGSFGMVARGAGTLDPDAPSLAVFSLLSLLPSAFSVVLVLLAFVLALSSVDTLLNGMVSTITSWNGVDEKDGKALRSAKILTVVIGIIAVLAGSRGESVLYLFLLADLICSAFAFPLLYGLFQRELTGRKALIAGCFGLATGAPFFPLPSFASWSGLPADMFISFLTALGVSALLSILFGIWDRKASAAG